MFGDGWFLGAMDSYLRLKRANAKSTYVYLLSHKISISFTSQTGANPDKFYGNTHVDDLIFLFPQRDYIFPNTLPTKEEEIVRKAMVQMWTDFARTGWGTAFFIRIICFSFIDLSFYISEIQPQIQVTCPNGMNWMNFQ